MELLAALGLGILTGLVTIEFEAWAPRLSDMLLRFAARWLPSDQQDRFLEEWRSLLADIPSPFGKLIHSASIILSMRRLGLLREIDPRFSCGVGDVKFYLALNRGVVTFDGTEPVVLATKEQLFSYLRHKNSGKIDDSVEFSLA